jgi:hypothetical protein
MLWITVRTTIADVKPGPLSQINLTANAIFVHTYRLTWSALSRIPFPCIGAIIGVLSWGYGLLLLNRRWT